MLKISSFSRGVRFCLRPVKRIMQRFWCGMTWDQWATRSWSQEGEDMVLLRMFQNKRNGSYVDVGAHHPKRFSNTYMFYRMGWSGINVDAMPGSMRNFERLRPRDVNIEMGVAKDSGSLDYYVFNESALNGFSKDLSRERDESDNDYYVKDVIKVDVCTLEQILDKHLSCNKIDFMSVDVEGLDLDVLQSNNWTKYRPCYVLAEILRSSLHELDHDPIVRFMREQEYVVFAKQVNTVIFKDISTEG
jgi:FkbM family methyltransferase